MGRAASLWLMFNIVVKTDGWWAGGQLLSNPRPPFVNHTSNVTNATSEDGSSLSFFSFGRLLQGVSPAPTPSTPDSTGVSPGAPSPPVDGELSWGWCHCPHLGGPGWTCLVPSYPPPDLLLLLSAAGARRCRSRTRAGDAPYCPQFALGASDEGVCQVGVGRTRSPSSCRYRVLPAEDPWERCGPKTK